MILCKKCGKAMQDTDIFCSKCGTKLESGKKVVDGIQVGQQKPVSKKKKKVIFGIMYAIIIFGIAAYMLVGKGCSSAKGDFISTGKPVGDFTFVPKQCRSGQRMNFFGAAILGEGPHDGAVVVINDALKGKIVKVEVPKSCKPPDHEECKEVIIEKKACSKYQISIKRTSTVVNDIRLIDGNLELECNFPEGGTLKAKIDFESCD
jgi:hypothetical protein